jgi:hypothetical protein
MILYNAFSHTLTGPATYRVKYLVESASTLNAITSTYAYAYAAYPWGIATPYVNITGTVVATPNGSAGVNQLVTLPQGYPHMAIGCSFPFTTGAVYIKNLQVEFIELAEVQDSDVFNAGRRLSYYEGSKMTSQDYNIDSPDTIDGGPVITVNTVTSNTPSSNPIGSSIGNPYSNVQAQQQNNNAQE